MKRIYDEENDAPYEEDDDFGLAGYDIDDQVSIFKTISDAIEREQMPEATPIPENEQTVILFEAQTAGLADGKEVSLKFDGDNCAVTCGNRKIGVFKPAYVVKLKAERGGQKVKAYFKADTPPMVRLVFGDEGEVI